MSDIQLKITDRDGKTHNVIAPRKTLLKNK